MREAKQAAQKALLQMLQAGLQVVGMQLHLVPSAQQEKSAQPAPHKTFWLDEVALV